jgi:hypothetical protein
MMDLATRHNSVLGELHEDRYCDTCKEYIQLALLNGITCFAVPNCKDELLCSQCHTPIKHRVDISHYDVHTHHDSTDLKDFVAYWRAHYNTANDSINFNDRIYT